MAILAAAILLILIRVQPIQSLSLLKPTKGDTSVFSRRKWLLSTAAGGSALPTITRPALAIFGLDDNRNDLDLCLVKLLRVTYFCQTMAASLQSLEEEEAIKLRYIETRLGAKAILTGKIGGGATQRIYTLSGGLGFRQVLDDLKYYSNGNSKTIDLVDDLRESLAALVEFDGLETTIDPSPRSSLMLSMYDSKKLVFVKRMLNERVIPTELALMQLYDDKARERAMDYAQTTYASEIPRAAEVVTPSDDSSTQ